ncbi:hypothetical protein FACS189487_01590 [Campylobacterota bacterium]|nr:hypothetical protein FACS189487_01590 [Campylobacterota bacterium]
MGYIARPDTNVVSRATTGSAFYWTFSGYVVEATVLETDVEAVLAWRDNDQSTPSNTKTDYKVKVRLPKGIQLNFNGSSRGYCALVSVIERENWRRDSIDVCLSDADKDGMFDTIGYMHNTQSKTAIKHNVITTKTVTPFVSSGQQQRFLKSELLYQGISNNTINVLYREYANDMARPAFFQNLSYSLEGKSSTIIRFKDASFEIIKADNNGMSYKVLQGL